MNGEIIGKPENREEAIETLEKLSGQTHTVFTGVCILHSGQKHFITDNTEVQFHTIDKKEILYYVEIFKPYDKAGAYAIQEWIGHIAIKKINGDFYNVMGLPASRVYHELKELGVLE